MKKKSGLLPKSGFTFIELIVAIALIAIMATIAIPNLWPRNVAQEQDKLVLGLNGFVRSAWHSSLVSGKVHKVVFDLKAGKVFGEVQLSEKNNLGEDKFTKMQIAYGNNEFKWNTNQFEVKDFLLGKKSMMNSFDGDSELVWFYIMPDGISQSVTIKFYDAKDAEMYSDSGEFNLVLNPFSTQFKFYETNQKQA